MSFSPRRKIVDASELVRRLAPARAAGQTIVQCHGCFDIVHPGHLRYLQFARQLGDVLVVSLTGDAGMAKGPDRPYIPQELRAENLAALELVDWVVVDPHPTAVELLDQLRPDIYVKGREYAHATDARFLRERETVERHGGRVVFHSGDVVFSSTALIRSLDRDVQLEETRLRAMCQRAEIHAESLRATLDRISAQRVVVVGDLVCERYVICDANDVANRAPVLALQQLDTREYWGGAAAVAMQVQALGATPCLLTAVGHDAESQRVTALCADLPFETHLLPERPTLVRRSTFVADDNKLFEVHEGGLAPLDTAAERRAWDVLQGQLTDASLVIWCDYGHGMVTPGLVRSVAEAKRTRGFTVAGCVPGPRGEPATLSGNDLLTVTERRLREVTHDMSSGLSAAAYHLLAGTDCRRLLVALHKRGLLAFDGRGPGEPTVQPPDRLRSEFVPALAPHYADLLGAEEAVLSAAALALTVDASLPLVTYIAAATEAIAVSRTGGRPVTTDELYAWFSGRPELWPESHFVADPPRVAAISPVGAGLPPGRSVAEVV